MGGLGRLLNRVNQRRAALADLLPNLAPSQLWHTLSLLGTDRAHLCSSLKYLLDLGSSREPADQKLELTHELVIFEPTLTRRNVPESIRSSTSSVVNHTG